MEHIVDTVLYFEGDKTLPYRVLRAVKNRYGSTNEIGMFDMTGRGLGTNREPLPGHAGRAVLLGYQRYLRGLRDGRHAPGAERDYRHLATKTSVSQPTARRPAAFDYNRMYLLLAVLEKRAGYVLWQPGRVCQHHWRPETGRDCLRFAGLPGNGVQSAGSACT